MKTSLLKNPCAFIPLAMSLVAIAMVAVRVTVGGSARAPDEGAAAHVWQLLLVAQIPFMAFFAIKWIRREPGPALLVLLLQCALLLAAIAPVFYLKL